MGPTWWSRRAVPWAVSGDGAGHKAERCSRACKGCSAAGFLDRPLQPGTPSRELASSTPPPYSPPLTIMRPLFTHLDLGPALCLLLGFIGLSAPQFIGEAQKLTPALAVRATQRRTPDLSTVAEGSAGGGLWSP